jgi:hypothetical protein
MSFTRHADRVGLVIERPRMPGENDGIAWFCEKCGAILPDPTKTPQWSGDGWK